MVVEGVPVAVETAVVIEITEVVRVFVTRTVETVDVFVTVRSAGVTVFVDGFTPMQEQADVYCLALQDFVAYVGG